MHSPRIALTMGDVAGIGPEVIARACAEQRILHYCTPVVFGHPDVLGRAMRLIGTSLRVAEVPDLATATEESDCVPCINPAGDAARSVKPGTVDERAGHAAYEYLKAAIDAARDGTVRAIVTAPLNKLALSRAGIPFPGHTEILADAFGVKQFAMLLYVPESEIIEAPHGLAVGHVTLHTSIASVPGLLSIESIREKIGLVDGFLRRLGCSEPRLGVCALNPHAGEGGLFGDEESRLIVPAIEDARSKGLEATGPLPADTLIHRAVSGQFDGVVAMYHDQGHIALKMLTFHQAVNVTLGLPIIRTSPSHGTAFDIAWQGRASGAGMLEAVHIASLLSQSEQKTQKQDP